MRWKLHVWTTPLWLAFACPLRVLLIKHPDAVRAFFAFQGADGTSGPSFASMMLAAGVCFSLIPQMAEQIDYLRSMPPRTAANASRGGRAVSWPARAGSSSARTKQVIGLFLAVYVLVRWTPPAAHRRPNRSSSSSVYGRSCPDWLAMTLALVSRGPAR